MASSHKNTDRKYTTITRAELAGGYFSKHVAFVIKTPFGVEIKRTYGDFEWIRYFLRILYPGAFIPPIPPKLPVAMWPQGYLLMRKRELQQFLQRLETIPHLKKDEITSFFLTNHGGSFDKARKKWEKKHPVPSGKALFDKLVATFPKIHETKTPNDIAKRCQESTKLVNESIKQLEGMIKSSEAFIEATKQCCDAMAEFKNDFEDLIHIEYKGVSSKYCTQKRIDISPHIEQWKTYKMDEINNMNIYYVPTLNRALNDLRVIEEILNTRDKIKSDYNDAQKAADGWKAYDDKTLRSSYLQQKHRDMQREEDLRNLSGFVEKLVLGQLNVVFCANTRRWKKSCDLFASKHLIALEKILGSLKNLTNKILPKKDDTLQKRGNSFVNNDKAKNKKSLTDKYNDNKSAEMSSNRIRSAAAPTEYKNAYFQDKSDDEVDRLNIASNTKKKDRNEENKENMNKDKEEKDEDNKYNENKEDIQVKVVEAPIPNEAKTDDSLRRMQVTKKDEELNVNILSNMGFSRDAAIKALQMTDNIDGAIDLLTTNPSLFLNNEPLLESMKKETEMKIENNDDATTTMDGSTKQFYNFLKQHRLEQYFDNFKENGCSDISYIEYFDENSLLNDIGIKNKFHRKKLLGECHKLKQQMDVFKKNNVISSVIIDKLSMHGIVTMNILCNEVGRKLDLKNKFGINDTDQCDLVWNVIKMQLNPQQNDQQNVEAVGQEEGFETAYL